MIKRNAYYAAIALLLASCGVPKDNDSFVLNGSLKGIPEGGAKLTRFDPTDRTTHLVDSIAFEGGKFTINGEIKQAEQMQLTIAPGNWSFNVFVEAGEIHVEADTTGSEHYDYEAYGGGKGAMVKNYKVSGSKNQDIMYAYQNHQEQKRLLQQLTELGNQYQAATEEEQRNHIKAQMEPLREAKEKWELGFIDSLATASPNMAAGALLLENHYTFNRSMTVADLEKRVLAFKAPTDSSRYVSRLKDIIVKKKAMLPGSVAPDFTLMKPDSSKFTLSSTRGQYVMIDFWASWCVPCRQAIPHWKEVYAKYHDKGFEIVALTNDNKWDAWFKALDTEKMPWIQVADEFPLKNMPAKIASQYMIPSLPTYVLLDKEGKIILHTTSKTEMDEQLNKLFM